MDRRLLIGIIVVLLVIVAGAYGDDLVAVLMPSPTTNSDKYTHCNSNAHCKQYTYSYKYIHTHASAISNQLSHSNLWAYDDKTA